MYNVKFLKGTIDEYSASSKNENTFYYVDEKELYLGTTKLSNGSDLAAAITRIAANETDISNLQEDIKALTGGETGSISGMIDDAVEALKNELTPKIEANETAISAINNETTGILAQAKTYADGKDASIKEAKDAAESAQSDVNALSEKVGTVTEGKTVVEMISEAQTAATYDDTQVKADIKTNKDAIDVLNGTGNGSVSKQVADAVANIVADAPEAYDTLKEISDWISSHADDASAMNTQINTNKEDITKLQTLIGQLPEGTDAKTIVAYIDSKVAGVKDWTNDIATAKSEAISAAATDAKSKADTAESNAKSYADGLASNYATADQGVKADSAVQEVKTGTTNGTISVDGTEVTVAGLGSAAYTESSAYDVAGSANTALTSAKAYTDSALTWGSIAE